MSHLLCSSLVLKFYSSSSLAFLFVNATRKSIHVMLVPKLALYSVTSYEKIYRCTSFLLKTWYFSENLLLRCTCYFLTFWRLLVRHNLCTMEGSRGNNTNSLFRTAREASSEGSIQRDFLTKRNHINQRSRKKKQSPH